MLSKIFRRIGFRILRFFVPEIAVLKKEISWNYYSNYKQNCKLSKDVKISPPYTLIDVSVGAYSYIDTNSHVSMAKIGKFCSIGPNFICGWGIHPTNGLSTAPMFYSALKQNGTSLSSFNKVIERKQISIGNDVFIGMNVTVLDGICIGDGAIIGAGSVVSKDIPPYAIAVGSPIKIIKYRFTDQQIEKLLKIKWWDFDNEKLFDVEQMFFDVDGFVKKYDA